MSQTQLNLVPKQYPLSAFDPALPTDRFVDGYERSECPYVPEPTGDWHWERSLLRDLVIWWSEKDSKHFDGLYLFGPHGAGKSRSLTNFCAVLGIPLYERTIYRTLEFPSLVTTTDLVGGSTLTNYGLLPLAMGADGYPGIFCANEIDRADEGMLTGMYEVLEGRPLITDIGGADIVKPAAGFRFAATGNTSMRGDPTGGYVGAVTMDHALADRFMKVKVSYLPPEVERRMIKASVPSLPGQLVDGMVQVANDIRAAFMGSNDSGDALPITMSTRSLLRWARYTLLYQGAERDNINPTLYALDRAFLNAADSDPAAQVAITKIVEGRLGVSSPQAGKH